MSQPVTITITRKQQYKAPNRNSRFDWKYIYSWAADDNSHMVQSGTRLVDIGTDSCDHLGSLRDMLKRRYAKLGKRVVIVEAWKF